ncbi:MAG: hypothetical protein PHE79_04915 [Eubacteriales bacterium]|nr:hypothetical protein [Eubacteriales bacterium]
MSRLYLAVTPDRYELPIAVCQSADELGQCLGVEGKTILKNLCRKESGKRRGYKLMRIEVGEDENEPTT